MDTQELLNHYQTGKRDFSGIYLSDTDLSGANLSRTNLSGANLSNTDLSGANLTCANLTCANLWHTDLSGANLNGADLGDTDMSGAYLRGANLCDANLSNTDLSGAYLSLTYWSGARLCGANLSGANLCRADLSDTDLSGADLSSANLSGANLSGADLSSADLSSADLSGADLTEANLESANLQGAKLIAADLTDANLERAYIKQANFTEAYLTNVNLKLAISEPRATNTSWTQLEFNFTDANISKHTKIQGILAELGKSLGFTVWVARNDHRNKYKNQELGKLSSKTFHLIVPQDFPQKTEKIIQLIDVIWFRKEFQQIEAALEVVCTTSIYSGLLRMADLSLCSKRGLFGYNAPDFHCYTVIPKARKRSFEKQLGRPTFQEHQIFQLCKAINIEDIESKWESDPNIIQKISYGLGEDAPIN
ncbi:pentapeptide repeat-containing protein [Microcoleus sp. S13_B4]|uniref:pentapeptide repeat-containing protein n=1 Tax=Microcoleus sp. S13_B4 TaxID=3055408 RepID=UPI002FD4E047